MHNFSFVAAPASPRGAQPETSRDPTGTPLLSGPVTADPLMQWILHVTWRVARTDLPVLLTGETGTGKEVLARQIHLHSPRAGQRFVAHNCSALPLSLLESELFGYERGAFTGAHRARRGLFDLADGGTLFLDEVSDLPGEAQPKLLRVLQDGELWPLGAEKPHRSNVRILAATNRDLEAEVQAGRFRSDLFYRLAVFPIAVPPLRDRRADIAPLAEHFTAVYSARCGQPRPRLSREALDLLEHYPFPGNVRELENLVARALVLLDEGGMVLPEHFPTLTRTERDPSLREQVKRFKVELIHNAICQEGSMVRAASRLGMSARNLHKLCHRLGLSGRSAGQVPI